MSDPTDANYLSSADAGNESIAQKYPMNSVIIILTKKIQTKLTCAYLNIHWYFIIN